MNSAEKLLAYVEGDSTVRAALFREYVAALKLAARAEGTLVAAEWARRAVSPELDYTSLLNLRKFLGQPAAGRNGNPLRLAVLGGPTTLQLVELMRVFLAAHGVPVAIYECEYGLFRQEVLTPGSGLDRFQPQIVFIATGARDVAALPPITAKPDEVEDMARDEVAGWLGLWETIRDRWGAAIIQNTFEASPWTVMGHFTLRHSASRESYLNLLNTAFAKQAPAHVVLHDVQALVTASGAAQWFDPRFYLEAKMPCGPECLASYAHSVSSLIAAMRGKSRKVLVLDLDNTLWGGVIGDAGVEGISLGQGSAQGEAFLHFQEYCRQLHDRGIVLAVCSKNDEQVARQPFLLRDDMILRLEHISCFIANWTNKADNLREIAGRLELGLDSFVFVDDNPAERAVVRRFLPEVAVPDMPEDPAGYIPALAKHRFFETIAWTSEDAGRTKYYSQNAERVQMASRFQDLGSFLESLVMRGKVEPVNRLNIERVAQLVNKSNQFNLTTRRRTLAQIEELAGNPNWITLTISLADRLGDNGLISVIFLRKSGKRVEIDTWLMSCRVLQRTVEQLALNEIVTLCGEHGCSTVTGVYIPTQRNGMVRDHYASLGFEPAGAEGEVTYWTLSGGTSYEPRQTYIEVERNDERNSRTLTAGFSAGI